jgi:hypothetical protein
MERLFQVLLIGSTLAFSWLAMMVVHEAGHVLHLWLSGGTVERVSLPPLGFSQTFWGANPHPLFVAWGGAVWGCAIPLLLFAGVRLLRRPGWYLFRFFAGFCLIANGAYLGVGAFFPGGGDDAGELLRHGAAPWQLVVFGLVTVGLGLRLWHNLGPSFGLGPDRKPVDRRATLGVTVALLALLAAEFLLDW